VRIKLEWLKSDLFELLGLLADLDVALGDRSRATRP
jgi:hypothetical protein